MNDTEDELKPERSIAGEGVDEDVVEYVEYDEHLHRVVSILCFDRGPVDAEKEVHEAHARLKEDEQEPAYD